MAVSKNQMDPDGSKSEQPGRNQSASKEQLRFGIAVQELEDALASGTWQLSHAWVMTILQALNMVQSLLREKRQAAGAEDSLLSQIASEAPRLEPRTRRLSREYFELERVVASLCAQVEPLLDTKNKVEHLRQRSRRMISELRRVEAKESELLYRALLVDIGYGD